MEETKTRPRGPSRVLLYNEHYYPLFPKGTFASHQGLPGKTTARLHRIHTIDDWSWSKASVSTSEDVNKEKPDLLAHRTSPSTLSREQMPRTLMESEMHRTPLTTKGEVTKFLLQTLAVGSIAAGFATLGGYLMEYILGKYLKKQKPETKRKFNDADEDTSVRAKW